MMILLVFATLLLVVGCAGPRPSYGTRQLGGAPAPPTTAPAQADDVQVITADVGEVASLDQELALDELESIEKDLDLGL